MDWSESKKHREEMLRRYELLASKHANPQNTIVNEFGGCAEVVVYKRPFATFTGENIWIDTETGEIVPESVVVDRSPCFVQSESGVLLPRKDDVKLNRIGATLRKSCNHAKDSFIGYVRVNKWQYFVTGTVDPNKWGTEDQTRRKLWFLFVRELQKINPDVKVLAVPERHKEICKNKDTLHFHALCADVDLTAHLRRARDPRNFGLLTTKHGYQIYNIDLWCWGYSTVVPVTQTQESYERVTNYLIKYVTKDGGVGYGQRRYYHTRNVEFKRKKTDNLSESQQRILHVMADRGDGVKMYKDTSRMTVYHVTDRKKLNQLYLMRNIKHESRVRPLTPRERLGMKPIEDQFDPFLDVF